MSLIGYNLIEKSFGYVSNVWRPAFSNGALQGGILCRLSLVLWLLCRWIHRTKCRCRF